MSNSMMKFVSINSQATAKIETSIRIKNFKEIYEDYPTAQLQEQASRCEQCGVPFCQFGCPIQNNIPDWLNLIAEGRYKEAWNFLNATSPLPEVCSRICPQDRLCEKTCVLNTSGHGAVQIGKIEKALTNIAFKEDWVEIYDPDVKLNKKIAIVGSGPAGLAMATYLHGFGYDVTVYERSSHAGGLLTFGIPSFKLDKDVVFKRVKLMEEVGIKFIYNCNVGKDITLEKLKSDFDVCVLACGIYKPYSLGIKGEDLQGVYNALDVLVSQNLSDLKEDLSDTQQKILDSLKNAKVSIIGGGDTAMDCVRTAIRAGAKKASVIYRRDQENMPGSKKEMENATEEGANFLWLSSPIEINGNDQGQVSSVKLQKMKLKKESHKDRAKPIPIDGDIYDESTDIVILALGFSAENFKDFDNSLNLDKWQNISVNESGETSINNVFAVGDCVEGASLAVKAIYNARNVSYMIDDFLKKSLKQG